MGYHGRDSFKKNYWVIILKTLTLLTCLCFTQLAFSSAKVCKNESEGIIEVQSDLKFYGSKSSLGPGCAEEISKMFNETKGELKIGNKSYKVKFKISHQVVTEEQTRGSTSINGRVENNYIRIEDKAYNDKAGRSNNEIRQNCGFYSGADSLGTSTTCAHEFGHSLGLLHYDDRPENKKKSMEGADLRGTGQPGIMAARGFIVDPKYQYNTKVRAGAPGGTINPALRKVKWQDIVDLKLDRLTFDSSGCARLGVVSNTVYKADGSIMEPKKWGVLLGTLDYITSGLVGNAPISCEIQKK